MGITYGQAERAEAREIAERWLEFKMNSLVDLVPGDPDCAACVLARQFIRSQDEIANLKQQLSRALPSMD
jgi:hypothetical protein